MRKRTWTGLGLVMLVAVFLTGCAGARTSTGPKNGQQLNVVTSLKVYREAAQAVLGKYGTATSIITSPNTDPHDYEPTTATGRTVADADVVVVNGLGYDDWLTKLRASASPSAQLVDVATTLGKGDGANEHVFYNPEVMPKLVAKLVRVYSSLDKQHAAAFRQNAQAYLATLAPLRKVIKQLHQLGTGKTASASEPVFDYALEAANYQLVDSEFAKNIEDGTDPAPQDLTKLRADLRGGSIDLFVQNVQSDSTIVDQVVTYAKKAGVPIIKVRETQPRGQTYLQWMLSNYQQILKAEKNRSM